LGSRDLRGWKVSRSVKQERRLRPSGPRRSGQRWWTRRRSARQAAPQGPATRGCARASTEHHEGNIRKRYERTVHPLALRVIAPIQDHGNHDAGYREKQKIKGVL
jgi:hypothetical protein